MSLRATSLSIVRRRGPIAGSILIALGLSQPAHASLFSGETLDLVADILAWIVLVVAPIIAIGVFWMVHILPERIAEKRHHPQAPAIKTLCLLSLFFGGLLWPLAWLWAYSKPVLYKIAYGEDTEIPPNEHEAESAGAATTPADGMTHAVAVTDDASTSDADIAGIREKRRVL